MNLIITKSSFMKKIFLSIVMLNFLVANGQENIYPSPAATGSTVITNATVHVGNGQVVNNASVVITNGKIAAVGSAVAVPPGSSQIDARGKHVYPGLISTVSNLGLVEIGAVRASSDVQEIGDMNPDVHAIIAYNTDGLY